MLSGWSSSSAAESSGLRPPSDSSSLGVSRIGACSMPPTRLPARASGNLSARASTTVSVSYAGAVAVSAVVAMSPAVSRLFAPAWRTLGTRPSEPSFTSMVPV